MTALVIFDTTYGNTKLVAEAVTQCLGEGARAVPVADLKEDDLSGIGLLVVGSPIIGWKPSENMDRFLASLSKGRLDGMKAAAFDTRVKKFISGDAAGKISRAIAGAGAEIIDKPKPFYVKGKEGPLLEGELERAKEWADLLKAKI